VLAQPGAQARPATASVVMIVFAHSGEFMESVLGVGPTSRHLACRSGRLGPTSADVLLRR
jgi:hypothetical protein